MNFFTDLRADLRYAGRLFRNSIGFSVVAICSLALGIGASSAIFSLVYAVLIDPYPYQNSDRMITPAFTDKHGRTGRVWYTIPDYQELRKSSRALEDAILFDQRPAVVTGALPEPVRLEAFSPNVFKFMGVPAMLGRTFAARDIPVPAAPPNIAVISAIFWQRHFNSDPGVVGKTLEINHQLYGIWGVLPPRFTWNDADVYVPLPMVADSRRPIDFMARMKPGVTLQAASAEMQALTERFAKRTVNVYPRDFRIEVKRLIRWLFRRAARIWSARMAILTSSYMRWLSKCGRWIPTNRSRK